MDLTKIVLPTFILERRSLLEMYADFFVHPQIFTDIASKTTQEERMIQVFASLYSFDSTPLLFLQVLKWYLSSFSASRKGNNAKKPYNPILGEVFQCWWPLPTPPGSTTPDRAGPLPWCSAKDMVFQAEQVICHAKEHIRKHLNCRCLTTPLFPPSMLSALPDGSPLTDISTPSPLSSACPLLPT